MKVQDQAATYAKPCISLSYLPLEVQPITLRAANAFVLKFHRHHRPVTGAKYAIGIFCQDGG